MKLEWTLHLAKKEPAKARVVYACAVLAGVFGVALVHNLWMFPVGVLIILASTADFILPVRYRLDEKGAYSRCGLSSTQISWENVKRVIDGDDGLKLSPLESSSRLAPFRGVLLRADGNLQEIRACVEYWRKQYAADVGATALGRGKDEDCGESGSRDKEAPPRDAGDTVSGNA